MLRTHFSVCLERGASPPAPPEGLGGCTPRARSSRARLIRGFAAHQRGLRAAPEAALTHNARAGPEADRGSVSSNPHLVSDVKSRPKIQWRVYRLGLLILAMLIPGCFENSCWTDTNATWNDPQLAAYAQRHEGDRWYKQDNTTWRGVQAKGGFPHRITVDLEGHAYAGPLAQQEISNTTARKVILSAFESVPAWPAPSFQNFNLNFTRACT